MGKVYLVGTKSLFVLGGPAQRPKFLFFMLSLIY